MKDIISKLKERKKKDRAHFTKKQKKEEEKQLVEQAKIVLDEQEKQEKKVITFLKNELPKYNNDKKKLLELNRTINDRFKVSSTKTRAAEYKTASIYFNALEIHKIPKDYYPKTPDDAPDFFITPVDQHYHFWNFQMETADNDIGHSIPDRPGTQKQFVIHGFLFPMTSTVIYISTWKSSNPNSNYLVHYEPNDELYGREWMSGGKEEIFKLYDDALKCFYDFIDNHLEGDEENYYEKQKKE